MKRIVLLFVLMWVSFVSFSQVNPQRGCIVTNEGDTIKGILDLRTNTINTKLCTFKADGQNRFKTYLPGEIDSYIFDIGKYYITYNYKNEKYFAEYLLKGTASVYKFVIDGEELLLIENEDAEVATISPDKGSEAFTADFVQSSTAKAKQLSTVLSNSLPTLSEINSKRTRFTERRVLELVKGYHQNVCTDGSDCIVYQRAGNVDNNKLSLRLYGGVLCDSPRRYIYNDSKGYTIGLGVDYSLERVLKGLSVEAGFNYLHYSCNNNVWNLNCGAVAAEFGGVYRISIAKDFNWILRAGYTQNVAEWESNGTLITNLEGKTPNPEWDIMHHLYFGTGLGFYLAGHEISLNIRYQGSKLSELDRYRLISILSVIL